MIFYGSIGNFLGSIKNKTPDGYPQIMYDVIIICLPMLLVGAIFGVYLNNLLPDTFILTALIVVLIISFKKTYKKY
jgi:hypothetical protein